MPDEPKKSGTSTPAAAAPIARAPARGKFAGEDEDDVEEVSCYVHGDHHED